VEWVDFQACHGAGPDEVPSCTVEHDGKLLLDGSSTTTAAVFQCYAAGGIVKKGCNDKGEVLVCGERLSLSTLYNKVQELGGWREVVNHLVPCKRRRL
jgi:hypothetical protein